MSLPAITMPSSLPAFLIGDSSLQPVDIYARIKPSQGHARSRRLTTSRLTSAHVATLLTAAQMQTLEEWWEQGLDVGSREFSARISGGGAAVQFWRAGWKAKYQCDPQPTGLGLMYAVTGDLVLSGEPYLVGPVGAALSMAVAIALTGSALIPSDGALSMAVVVDLAIPAPLSMAVELSLRAGPSAPLSLSVSLALLQVGAPPGLTGYTPPPVAVVMQFAGSDETTALATGLLITLPVLQAFALSTFNATVVTAQATGTLLQFDVKLNGASLFATKPTIDNTEKTTTTAATPYALTGAISFAVGDVVTVYCTAIGDGLAAGAKFGLVGTA